MNERAFCCHTFRELVDTERRREGLERQADGTWSLWGCCHGGCYVATDIRFCPWCGAGVVSLPEAAAPTETVIPWSGGTIHIIVLVFDEPVEAGSLELARGADLVIGFPVLWRGRWPSAPPPELSVVDDGNLQFTIRPAAPGRLIVHYSAGLLEETPMRRRIYNTETGAVLEDRLA